MSYPSRNVVVARLGTPDRTEGSVNDPRIIEENGIRFNEKWHYSHVIDDPSGAPQRLIYWNRYDIVGTKVREDENCEWRDDGTLSAELARANPRLAALDYANNPPLTRGAPYRAVSDFVAPADLGGYVLTTQRIRGYDIEALIV
jgi:hypothetical protein